MFTHKLWNKETSQSTTTRGNITYHHFNSPRVIEMGDGVLFKSRWNMRAVLFMYWEKIDEKPKAQGSTWSGIVWGHILYSQYLDDLSCFSHANRNKHLSWFWMKIRQKSTWNEIILEPFPGSTGLFGCPISVLGQHLRGIQRSCIFIL